MEIYPAIDVMGGQCVRLQEGNFENRTDYGGDPLGTAKGYKSSGSSWLHLVDLDGARDPRLRQTAIMAEIIKGTGLNVQIGGGVRRRDEVMQLLKMGVKRVVLGSLCVKEPENTQEILNECGAENITLAFDVRGDAAGGFFVATSGWTQTSGLRVEDLLLRYQSLAKHILCTDISRDGMMGGPNIELYKHLLDIAPDMEIQASGGISSLDDIRRLKGTGVSGAIIGKALFEGSFSLSDAMDAAL